MERAKGAVAGVAAAVEVVAEVTTVTREQQKRHQSSKHQLKWQLNRRSCTPKGQKKDQKREVLNGLRRWKPPQGWGRWRNGGGTMAERGKQCAQPNVAMESQQSAAEVTQQQPLTRSPRLAPLSLLSLEGSPQEELEQTLL